MTILPGADHLVLADPELMLEEDIRTLAGSGRITAVGSFSITVKSPEEIMAARSEVERRLEAKVQPHQRAITAPGFILIEWTETFNIYGEIYDGTTAYNRERATGAGPDEAGTVLRRITDAQRRGWFYGRFYSSAEPEGELGCMHRAHIAHALTRDEFETARQELWP